MLKTSPQEMGKMWVEFCIVSARGLHRPSLWKLHWFAVAWVDPDDKYCTRIDASGNPNPVWRTKFSAVVDAAAAADCALHVEVYSRDPVFLREKLHGSAQVSLKEFLADKEMKSDFGSFQLRRIRNRNGSNKPKGFVDVSVRTSMDKQSAGAGADYEGFQLAGNSDVISLAREREAGPVQVQGLHQVPFRQPPNPAPPTNYTYTHPTPYPSNYNNPSLGGPSYPPAASYSYPRPPPSSSSYLNLPPSAGGGGAAAAGVRPGFAAGVGAGALAAGAVIFGDDFMSSGFDLPSGGLRYPSLNVSIDPPF